MPCNHPFKAFETGYLTAEGKRELVIAYDDVDSSLLDLDRVRKPVDLAKAPHVMINGKPFLSDPIPIPCGSCIGCRMDKAREWKIRNCLELQYNPECYFVTLTYSDRYLPRLDDGTPFLYKKQFQLFLKRLRRRIGSFRYFGCGEYGEHTGRPHAHFLIYGHLSDFRLVGPNKFQCQVIDESWRYGSTLVETVSPGSIAYVSGYVEKKYKADLECYPVKPFLMMSRKPGIGMAYLEDNVQGLEKDMHVYGRFSDNVLSSHSTVPKAFRRKLEGLPWYEKWKAAAVLAGESMDATLKVVYGCAQHAMLAAAIDNAQRMKLEKKEKFL